MASKIDFSEDNWKKIRKQLRKEYNCKGLFSRLDEASLFFDAVKLIDSVVNIHNKKILDIGCGSEKGRSNYAPWFCRILYELGVDVVGVDYCSLDGEKFKYKVFNVKENDLSRIFEESQFDIVHSTGLLDSEFKLGYGEHGELPRRERNKLSSKLFSQIKTILAPGGYYISTDLSICSLNKRIPGFKEIKTNLGEDTFYSRNYTFLRKEK